MLTIQTFDCETLEQCISKIIFFHSFLLGFLILSYLFCPKEAESQRCFKCHMLVECINCKNPYCIPFPFLLYDAGETTFYTRTFILWRSVTILGSIRKNCDLFLNADVRNGFCSRPRGKKPHVIKLHLRLCFDAFIRYLLLM